MSSLRVAIYEPPASDLPFLVISKIGDEVHVTPARTRREARVVASSKAISEKSKPKKN